MAEKSQPVLVQYCNLCGLPAKDCEVGPEFNKCKPWLIQTHPTFSRISLKQQMLKKLIKLLISYNPLESLLLMLLQVVVQNLSKRKLSAFLGGRLERWRRKKL